MANDFYVYAWLRPCGEPFYIGKGRGSRDAISKRNRLFQNITAKIRESGQEPTIIRILEHLSEASALDLEVALIRQYGRRDKGTGILANATDGGEGASGYVHTKVARERIAEALRGKIRDAEIGAKISAALLGRPLSDEHREKLSLSHLGNTHDAATRAKIGAGSRGNTYRLGQIASPETRAKLSASLKGHAVSDETRAKLSESLRGNTNSLGRNIGAEHRAKLVAANTGKVPSEETRAKLRASSTGRIKSEETRRAVSLAGRTASPRNGFKGVFPLHAKWMARIKLEGKPCYLGSFQTPEHAALAYDQAAYAAWGDACYLNFPDKIGGNIAA